MFTFTKRIILQALTILVSVASYAGVEIEGICYDINERNQTASVIEKTDKYSGNVVIPATITYKKNTYAVQTIEERAFFECSDLTSVTLPNSITEIGDNAFWSCGALEDINIPESVENIGQSAFWGCGAIKSINIPESISEIKDNTFFSCWNLKSITIPKKVRTIGNNAFGNCYYLSSITIPNSVEKIEGSAFYGCANLSSITVEEGNNVYDSRNKCNAIIETATNALMTGCNNTNIPESVTSIRDNAFSGNILITEIFIPKSVENIGSNPFSECKNLTSIIVEEGNKVYDSKNNCNAIINTKTNELIAGCSKTIIPEYVTSITTRAFYRCDNLNSIILPNSVTTIGYGAFEECKNLVSVVLGSSVAYIDMNAFIECPLLKDVTILTKTPPTIYSFEYLESFNTYGTLHVLPGCKAVYEAVDGWNKFTIVEDAIEQGAEATIALINGIGKVELSDTCKEKINAARAAYDALSKEEQALVKNYNILIEAEEAYNKLSTTTGIFCINTDTVKKDGKYLSNGKLTIVKNGKTFNAIGVSE